MHQQLSAAGVRFHSCHGAAEASKIRCFANVTEMHAVDACVDHETTLPLLPLFAEIAVQHSGQLNVSALYASDASLMGRVCPLPRAATLLTAAVLRSPVERIWSKYWFQRQFSTCVHNRSRCSAANRNFTAWFLEGRQCRVPPQPQHLCAPLLTCKPP